jgi:hypothetical protein
LKDARIVAFYWHENDDGRYIAIMTGFDVIG